MHAACSVVPTVARAALCAVPGEGKQVRIYEVSEKSLVLSGCCTAVTLDLHGDSGGLHKDPSSFRACVPASHDDAPVDTQRSTTTHMTFSRVLFAVIGAHYLVTGASAIAADVASDSALAEAVKAKLVAKDPRSWAVRLRSGAVS
jgi:hypothetical protein